MCGPIYEDDGGGGGGDNDDNLNTLSEETLWTGTSCIVYRKLISVSNFRRHEDTNLARKKSNMEQFH